MKEETEKVKWAFSILSDVQELIAKGMIADAYKKINDAKRVLNGNYENVELGMIQIIRGKRADEIDNRIDAEFSNEVDVRKKRLFLDDVEVTEEEYEHAVLKGV